MSSHHVVRENQEPAVLFIEATNCDLNILNQALEWSPFVIATPASSKFLLDQGIKVDVIFYEDQQLVNHIHLNQSNIELIQYEGNLLKEALLFLRKRNHFAVYIFSAFEKIPAFLAKNSNLTINIFDFKTRWALVQNSTNKWFPKGRQLLVLGSNVRFFRYDKELQGEDLKPTKANGIIKFRSDGCFWLGEILT